MLTAFIVLALSIIGIVLLIRTEQTCKLPEEQKFDPEKILKSIGKIGKDTLKKASKVTSKINPFSAKKPKVEILSKPPTDENGNEKGAGSLKDLLEENKQ